MLAAVVLSLCGLLGVDAHARARSATASVPALTQLPPHPRLIWTEDDVATLLGQLATDAAAARLYAVLVEHGTGLANGSVPSGGLWDASYSFGVLHRVECAQRGFPRGACTTTWATAGIRALLGLAAAADPCGDCKGNCSAMGFFTQRDMGLCSASNAEGLAVGFDWLYNAMSDDERRTVAVAITNQVLDVYSQGMSAAFVHSYWTMSLDNFNTAINSGAILAALAVADADGTPNTTAFASDTFSLAVISLQRSTANVFAADGGHPEGPTYTTFAYSHLQPAVDALRTAVNTTAGIALPPAGGRQMLDVAGPSNLYFNYADTAGCTSPTAGCGLADGYEYGYALGWFARRSGDAALGYVAVARAALLTSPVWGTPGHYEPSGARWLMTWPTAIGNQSDLDALPPSRLMNESRVAFLRTGWAEPVTGGETGRGSTFAAIKGCDNTLQQIIKGTTHTHADCGAFVIDAGGVRFATDLGSGPYLSQDPPYFSLHKWDAVFYESSTAGHNTLMFGVGGGGGGGELEPQDACATWSAAGPPATSDDPSCAGDFDGFSADADTGDGWATLHMSSVYAGSTHGASVRRGLALRSAAAGGTATDWVAIADEFPGAVAAAGGVRWSLHSFASVSVTAATGPVLRAQLSAPARNGTGAAVLGDVVVDATGCPGAVLSAGPAGAPNVTAPPNITRLAINSASGACVSLRVVVGLAPVPDSAPGSVSALSAWPSSGPWQ
jgi:hypothetical protein